MINTSIEKGENVVKGRSVSEFKTVEFIKAGIFYLEVNNAFEIQGC